jgi:hypothetical protein
MQKKWQGSRSNNLMQNDEIEKNKSLKNWEKKLNPLELTWPTRYSWHEIKIKKKILPKEAPSKKDQS